MVIDLHAKNQVNICKYLGKKSGKLILKTDRHTDERTECKSKVSFSFAGKGLIKHHSNNQISLRGGPGPGSLYVSETSYYASVFVSNRSRPYRKKISIKNFEVNISFSERKSTKNVDKT